MTVRECYVAMGASYDEILGRLANDDRIKKFLGKFQNEKSFELLCSSIEERNMEEAFRAAHTLKGVSQNLAFTPLVKSVSALTEQLRNRTEYGDDIEPLLQQVKEDYNNTLSMINSLLAE